MMTNNKHYPTPEEIKNNTTCPRCGVGSGENCMGVRGKERKANHLERVKEYSSLLRKYQ